MLRKLSAKEIEEIISVWPKAKHLAVKNFLSTVHYNRFATVAVANLLRDAKLYGWDGETIRAIKEGIKKAMLIPPSTIELHEALMDSIMHWEEMIEWVKQQPPTEEPSTGLMESEIQQDWYAESCSLCQLCNINEYDIPCFACPLANVFGNCCDQEAMNAWLNVRHACSWKEWLEAAEIMLEQLKVALMFLGKENKPFYPSFKGG